MYRFRKGTAFYGYQNETLEGILDDMSEYRDIDNFDGIRTLPCKQMLVLTPEDWEAYTAADEDPDAFRDEIEEEFGIEYPLEEPGRVLVVDYTDEDAVYYMLPELTLEHVNHAFEVLFPKFIYHIVREEE